MNTKNQVFVLVPSQDEEAGLLESADRSFSDASGSYQRKAYGDSQSTAVERKKKKESAVTSQGSGTSHFSGKKGSTLPIQMVQSRAIYGEGNRKSELILLFSVQIISFKARPSLTTPSSSTRKCNFWSYTNTLPARFWHRVWFPSHYFLLAVSSQVFYLYILPIQALTLRLQWVRTSLLGQPSPLSLINQSITYSCSRVCSSDKILKIFSSTFFLSIFIPFRFINPRYR